jgi:RimJ/RimL family protein N-acetyltransferase
MSACPRLETDRLILRPFIDGDVDDYFAVLNTAEVRQALHLSESLDRSDAWNHDMDNEGDGTIYIYTQGERLVHWTDKERSCGVSYLPTAK